ncbi:hypothetical protein BC829DRAFT_192856 [Chytridium lagenaria]|nr:hypothetical protein BC829DRAFT_192856 [Chytridium lagenaria]
MRVSSASASIAKMLVFTGMISLAVMPQAVDAFSGSLSWFDTETGNAGACGSFSRNSDYIVALSENYVNRNGPLRNVCYNSICIRYRDRVVQAAIYDLCPDNGCTGDGLDATPSLFQALTGDLGIGRTSIEWWFANNGGCGSAPEPPRLLLDPQLLPLNPRLLLHGLQPLFLLPSPRLLLLLLLLLPLLPRLRS